ncbi:MAG: hypothetical protein HY459_01590 [Parcubacteria group bacterium]|nr:hypothetical protein [Parcubacteria group bacterium]
MIRVIDHSKELLNAPSYVGAFRALCERLHATLPSSALGSIRIEDVSSKGLTTVFPEDVQRSICVLQKEGFYEKLPLIIEKVTTLLGRDLPVTIYLTATCGLLDGITTYDHEMHRFAIVIGVDYPHDFPEYHSVLLAHELGHVARDTSLPGYFDSIKGKTHDTIIAAMPFAEQMVGEGIATYFSEMVLPHLAPRHYLYFTADQLQWLTAHHSEVMQRLLDPALLATTEVFFYEEHCFSPGSPDRPEYYLGYLIAKAFGAHLPLATLLATSAQTVIAQAKTIAPPIE